MQCSLTRSSVRRDCFPVIHVLQQFAHPSQTARAAFTVARTSAEFALYNNDLATAVAQASQAVLELAHLKELQTLLMAAAS